MGQSTGEQATEPSCRTQNKALRPGAGGTREGQGTEPLSGHQNHRGRGRGPWWGRGMGDSVRVCLCAGTQAPQATGPALCTEHMSPGEQTHELPKNVSSRAPEGGPEAEAPHAHGREPFRTCPFPAKLGLSAGTPSSRHRLPGHHTPLGRTEGRTVWVECAALRAQVQSAGSALGTELTSCGARANARLSASVSRLLTDGAAVPTP